MKILKDLIRLYINKWKHPKTKLAFSSIVSLDTVLGEHVHVLRDCRLASCTVGRYTYIGEGCRFSRTLIGSFTSIGEGVLCGLGGHPINFVSTYPGFYTTTTAAVWFGIKHDFMDKPTVQIGSDVWIGARAIIVGGIKIGHGAIIGAGAIVTKDIPPYAIAVGSPAKIIKYRFNEEICESLLASKWWNLSDDALTEASKHIDDPIIFLKML